MAVLAKLNMAASHSPGTVTSTPTNTLMHMITKPMHTKANTVAAHTNTAAASFHCLTGNGLGCSATDLKLQQGCVWIGQNLLALLAIISESAAQHGFAHTHTAGIVQSEHISEALLHTHTSRTGPGSTGCHSMIETVCIHNIRLKAFQGTVVAQQCSGYHHSELV